MCINSKENYIYVITNQGQMIGGSLDCKSNQGLPFSIPLDYV